MTIEDNTIDLDTIENAIARHEREIARLQREREQITTIQVKMYLHNNKDEYEEWEVDDDYKPRWSPEVHNKLHYALYEVEFDMEIDLTTGDDKILRVTYGDQVLVPQEES